MEDRRREARVGARPLEERHVVVGRRRAAGGDDRYADRVRDSGREPEIEPELRAVAIDAVEEDLPRAAGHRGSRPFDRVASGGDPPAVDDHLPPVGAARLLPRVDGEDGRLRAVAVRDRREERGISDRGAVDRDLVRTRPQDLAGEIGGADAATDGERDEQDVRDVSGERDDRRPALRRRGDVEEDELVPALEVVALRELDRVSGVPEVGEARALHDAAVLHIEARDDPFREHQRRPLTTTPASAVANARNSRRPLAPDFSGWNCTPRSRSRPAIASRAPPYSTVPSATSSAASAA